MSEIRDHEAAFAFFSESSFGTPEWMPLHSPWLEHGPFTFWLNEVFQPLCLVELGASDCFSHMAFCQGVKRFRTGAKCFAVGSWREGPVALGGEIFAAVEENNRQQYADFSTLVESASLQAWNHFPEGSIDLLLVDGRLGGEAFACDWANWQRRMSDRGVILFHSPRSSGGGFLWEELSAIHPHFEFSHGYGLGIVGIGKKRDPILGKLFDLPKDSTPAQFVRQGYSRLGETVSLTARLRDTENRLEGVLGVSAKSLQQQVLHSKDEIFRIHREKVVAAKQVHRLEGLLLAGENEKKERMQEIGVLLKKNTELQGENDGLREKTDEAQRRNRELQEEGETLRRKNRELQGKTEEFQAALDDVEAWQKSWLRRTTGRWHRSREGHHPHLLERWARSVWKRLPGHQPGKAK